MTVTLLVKAVECECCTTLLSGMLRHCLLVYNHSVNWKDAVSPI